MNDYSSLFVGIMGMVTVFVGLIFLIVILEIVSSIVRKLEKPQPEQPPVVPVKKQEITGELIAAISAAIAENEGTDISAIRINTIKKIS